MLPHLLHITQPLLPKVRATPPPQAVLTQTVRVPLLGCAEECQDVSAVQYVSRGEEELGQNGGYSEEISSIL